MPRQGAAILSQIQGLMQQFLALDYDSPVKQTIEQMLPAVESGMAQLSAQADGMEQQAMQQAQMPAEMPVPDQAGMPPADSAGPPPKTFGQARGGAKAMLQAQKGQNDEKNDSQQDDSEEVKKKKKAKAY